MLIEWRGGIGYGDFVTGLGYAHNCALKYQTNIDFKIHWDHDTEYKPNKNDPETILERCQYIYNLFDNNRVSLSQITNSKPSFRFINQFHEFNPLHGMHQLPLPVNQEKYVVMWSSITNTTPVAKFKDPLTKKEWKMTKDIIKDFEYNVVEVDYRTPVTEVITLCKNAVGGVGYDGSIHQIFKLIQKPVILFCERTSLNELLLPWATQYKTFADFFSQDVLFDKSQQDLFKWQLQYKDWINDKKDFTKEKLYNIPT